MIRYLEISEVIHIHDAIMQSSGGLNGIRDQGGLESALILPKMEVFGQILYPTITEKAAVLGFALITNHPFLDGNKRIGHAVMEIFLVMNGYEIIAGIDEQETVILQIAAGNMNKETFTEWLKTKIKVMSA
jgi:death-on-curing protein